MLINERDYYLSQTTAQESCMTGRVGHSERREDSFHERTSMFSSTIDGRSILGKYAKFWKFGFYVYW